jgi:hypothetical protein
VISFGRRRGGNAGRRGASCIRVVDRGPIDQVPVLPAVCTSAIQTVRRADFAEILKGTPLQDAMDPDFTAAAGVWALITQAAMEGKKVPRTGFANVTLVDKNKAQAAIDAEKDPFGAKYIKRTLSAVALYPGTCYSLTKLTKGPGSKTTLARIRRRKAPVPSRADRQARGVRNRRDQGDR